MNAWRKGWSKPPLGKKIARCYDKIALTLIKLNRREEGQEAERAALEIQENLPEVERAYREWWDGYP
ncbi:hypothetical protein Q4539_00065 [Yoonia sp. 1_MG-2023]|nr:hypothetical protein [Yoonia sp. 1_MG-2023]